MDVTPDIVSKLNNIISDDKMENTPKEGEVKRPLLTSEHLLALYEMVDKISPESSEATLDNRVAHSINKAHVHGQIVSSGIAPVMNDNQEVIGYVHPTDGFFCSKETMTTNINEAFNKGFEAGKNEALLTKPKTFTEKCEYISVKLFRVYQTICGYILIMLVGLYLAPFIKHFFGG